MPVFLEDHSVSIFGACPSKCWHTPKCYTVQQIRSPFIFTSPCKPQILYWVMFFHFQAVASLNQDHLTLAVALEMEKAFGGWVPPSITVWYFHCALTSLCSGVMQIINVSSGREEQDTLHYFHCLEVAISVILYAVNYILL